MPETLVLSADDVRRVLPVRECIDVMREAFVALAEGRATVPVRTALAVGDQDERLLLMPAVMRAHGDDTATSEGAAAASDAAHAWFGAKVLSVVPGNAAKGRDSHQGVVVLFEGEYGSVVAMIDAGAITAIRTAAVSAVATQTLARADAGCLALIGSGVQAASHLAAMAAVRPLREVRVWSPDRERCAAFVKRATEEFGVNTETGARVAISAAARPRDAVAEADIICTVCAATTPVIESSWIRAGTHINAVGGHRPHERELDSATIQRARVFVDYLPSAMEEAGDILIPIGEHVIDRTHVLGDLTSIVTNRVPGRVDPKDVTIFKSVGLAIEDIAAAAHAWRRALASGVGTRVANTQ
jgi:ornithine cyclodeaminase/alanine dehydrogenase-like protein (mu-crystallin family)